MTKRRFLEIGVVYNNWIVLENGDKAGYAICKCLCDKNTIKPVKIIDLEKGYNTNCGCIKSKKLSEIHLKYKNGESNDKRFVSI